MTADPEQKPRAWPAAQVEMWQVADLAPYAKNARQHPAEQIDQIAASMQRFGFTIPMLVAENGTIIAGHGRLMAAAQLGLTEVPVMVARGWSEEDRRLYTLADNRLAEIAKWDPEMLRLEIEDLHTDFGIEDFGLIGFSADDLAEILPDALLDATGGLTDPDDVPETPAQPVTKPGDLWTLGGHRLLCGDSTVATDVERILSGVKPLLKRTERTQHQPTGGRCNNAMARFLSLSFVTSHRRHGPKQKAMQSSKELLSKPTYQLLIYPKGSRHGRSCKTS